jgi:hypothetical protein
MLPALTSVMTCKSVSGITVLNEKIIKLMIESSLNITSFRSTEHCNNIFRTFMPLIVEISLS